jgi:uncharacterized protein (DUF952 family)
MTLFHITTQQVWDEARDVGRYVPPAFDHDGFIHLSEERQWINTANRFYRGRPSLVVLVIDEKRLASEVRREPADGDLFPHLYGPLNLDAVSEVYQLRLAANGDILVPAPLFPAQATDRNHC